MSNAANIYKKAHWQPSRFNEEDNLLSVLLSQSGDAMIEFETEGEKKKE